MSTRSPEPRARPAAVTVAVAAALAVVTLGVLLVLDAVLPETGDHRSQVLRLAEWLDGASASGATTAAGLVVTVVGVALVVAAVRPARRTHLRTRSSADVWLTPRAVADLATRSAERQPGVLDARTTGVRRRRVTLLVTPRRLDAGAELAATVQHALRDELDRVEGTSLVVRHREEA